VAFVFRPASCERPRKVCLLRPQRSSPEIIFLIPHALILLPTPTAGDPRPAMGKSYFSPTSAPRRRPGLQFAWSRLSPALETAALYPRSGHREVHHKIPSDFFPVRDSSTHQTISRQSTIALGHFFGQGPPTRKLPGSGRLPRPSPTQALLTTPAPCTSLLIEGGPGASQLSLKVLSPDYPHRVFSAPPFPQDLLGVPLCPAPSPMDAKLGPLFPIFFLAARQMSGFPLLRVSHAFRPNAVATTPPNWPHVASNGADFSTARDASMT